jgi:hypothetical protein
MKTVELKKCGTSKRGDKVGNIGPNITEDSLFVEEGEVVGFYISRVGGRAYDLLSLCNKEFRSKRVPKSLMQRQNLKKDNEGKLYKFVQNEQYSTILGSVPPKPHMRRPYPTRSSVHLEPKAKIFIRGMIALAKESEKLIEEIMPEQYKRQSELIEQWVPEKWRFANLFTSSISNYNISAPIHQDSGNIIGASNSIFSIKKQAEGGNLHLPEYGATIESGDGSMIFYPAWRNLHGVTPIKTLSKGGYRNSLVFYPLKAFRGL